MGRLGGILAAAAIALGVAILAMAGLGVTGAWQVGGRSELSREAAMDLDVSYTDKGANGQPSLTTHTQHTLQPRHRQAEQGEEGEKHPLHDHSPAMYQLRSQAQLGNEQR